MYKIVNNNITITRGETATYNVKVIDKATGAPFILPKTALTELGNSEEMNTYYLVFTVRRGDYEKQGVAFKKNILVCGLDGEIIDTPENIMCMDQRLPDTTEIYEFSGEDFDDTYGFVEGTQPFNIKAVFGRKKSDGAYEYRVNVPEYEGPVDENYEPTVEGREDINNWTPHWLPYSFEVKFPFLYSDTADLAPKGYRYAMTVYGGRDLQIEGDKVTGTIDYKKPLVDGTFTVEADINE